MSCAGSGGAAAPCRARRSRRLPWPLTSANPARPTRRTPPPCRPSRPRSRSMPDEPFAEDITYPTSLGRPRLQGAHRSGTRRSSGPTTYRRAGRRPRRASTRSAGGPRTSRTVGGLQPAGELLHRAQVEGRHGGQKLGGDAGRLRGRGDPRPDPGAALVQLPRPDVRNVQRFNYFRWFSLPGEDEARFEMSVVGRQVDVPGLQALFDTVGASVDEGPVGPAALR